MFSFGVHLVGTHPGSRRWLTSWWTQFPPRQGTHTPPRVGVVEVQLTTVVSVDPKQVVRVSFREVPVFEVREVLRLCGCAHLIWPHLGG